MRPGAAKPEFYLHVSANWGRLPLALAFSSVTLLSAPPEKKPAPAPAKAAPKPSGPAHAAPGKAGAKANGAARPGQTLVKKGPGPAHAVTRTPNGAEVHRNASGKVVEVHTPNGGVIRHSPSGVRHVEMKGPGGRTIVAHGQGGFVQRPFESHGHTYEQRSYVRGGVTYSRIYRPVHYGGHDYHFYAREHYYRPGFYRWAGNPYAHPYPYRWGWEARPWYGYYGAYYTPYPTYAAPSFWLTDYMVAAALESGYPGPNGALASFQPAAFLYFSASLGAPLSAAPGDAALSDAPAAPMSEEARQALADEVKRQLDQAKDEQGNAQDPAGAPTVPAIFTDHGPRTFLVSEDVAAVVSATQEISLAHGDVITLTKTPVPESDYSEVKVLAASKASCPAGTLLQVKTEDLIEMQNQMQATLDQGMAKLQTKMPDDKPAATKGGKATKAKDSWPLPPKDAVGTVDADFAKDVHPDPEAATVFSSAVKDADQAEQEAIQQDEAAAAAPPQITKGMSISEVKAALGEPVRVTDLFLVKVYHYKNMTIYFNGATVARVEAVP